MCRGEVLSCVKFEDAGKMCGGVMWMWNVVALGVYKGNGIMSNCI